MPFEVPACMGMKPRPRRGYTVVMRSACGCSRHPLLTLHQCEPRMIRCPSMGTSTVYLALETTTTIVALLLCVKIFKVTIVGGMEGMAILFMGAPPHTLGQR